MRLTYTPTSKPGMSDVFLLSEISGLSFDSPFLSPFFCFCLVLLLLLSCPASANGPLSWLLHSQKILLVPLRERLNSCTANGTFSWLFHSQKIILVPLRESLNSCTANDPFCWLFRSQKIILVPLRERLNSCTALLEEMIVGGTDVELSANWRWYHFYIEKEWKELSVCLSSSACLSACLSVSLSLSVSF